MARKRVFAGVDDQYVLVRGRAPKRGTPIVATLRMLTDATRFPGDPSTTTDRERARTWHCQSGAYVFLIRHPQMRGRWYVVNLAAVGASSRHRVRRPRSLATAAA